MLPQLIFIGSDANMSTISGQNGSVYVVDLQWKVTEGTGKVTPSLIPLPTEAINTIKRKVEEEIIGLFKEVIENTSESRKVFDNNKENFKKSTEYGTASCVAENGAELIYMMNKKEMQKTLDKYTKKEIDSELTKLDKNQVKLFNHVISQVVEMLNKSVNVSLPILAHEQLPLSEQKTDPISFQKKLHNKGFVKSIALDAYNMLKKK